MISDLEQARIGASTAAQVELSRCAAMVFERFGVDCQAASPWKPTTMAVHEKHQIFIHQQSQPSAAQRPSGYP